MKNKTLLVLLAITVASCSAKEQAPVELSYKEKSKIVMQRVKDTTPLSKQDLVSREAMQYAMLDKMNVREDRQRREFKRIQDQQRDDFLESQQAHINRLDAISDTISSSHEEVLKSHKDQNKMVIAPQQNFDNSIEKLEEFNKSFRMIASKIQDDSQMQSRYFNEMKISYENELAFKEAKLAREKERENTIRGVVENMYEDQGAALTKFYSVTKEGMLPPSEWVSLDDSKITLHVEDEKFEDLMLRAVNHAAINAGPWQLKWKLKKENEILLFTKFSLDAETTFGEFIANVRQYIVNYNGVRLNFRVFKEKRVLIVSDS